MFTTVSNRNLDLFNLKKEDIDIWDIGHSLSMINRFNGHSQFPISVAQHSVYVAKLVESTCKNPLHVKQALLHDAAEAYLGDVTRWLKLTETMAPYRELEQKIEKTIFTKFSVPTELVGCVKEADFLMVRFEARQAFGEDFDFGGNIEKYPPIDRYERQAIGTWGPWDWREAREIFCQCWQNLSSLSLKMNN